MLNRLVKAGKINPEHLNIISNTGWLFSSKVFRILISLLISTWIARYLEPVRFGTLQYALAFCSFFVPLSTSQLRPVVTRELVRYPDEKNSLLGTAVILQLMGGFLAATLSIISILIFAPEDTTTSLLVAILSLKFIFNSFQQPIEAWFESQVSSRFTVLASNIAFTIVTALEILLVLSQAPVFAFAGVTVLESMLLGLGLIHFYQKNNSDLLKWHFNFDKIRALLKESFPLILSSTAYILYLNIDRVMLGNMVGPQAVGIYSSAATISESLTFLPVIICSSLYPLIIQSQNLGGKLYQARLQKFYDLISALAYIVIIILFPLSGSIIIRLYGNAYESATPILAIYIWSSLFAFVGIAQTKWIITEGLQKYNFYSRLAGLISNILLNLLLIPFYQGIGAAIATIISYAIGGYLFFFFIPQTRPNAVLMTKSFLAPIRWIKALT